MIFALLMCTPAFAQTTYTATVVDEADEPVIGASVKVVGTTTGTVTDFDGKFSLTVPKGKSVEISFIGYVTQHITDFAKNKKVTLLEDTQRMEEVVVVGYASQKKAHLTGSVATVPMDDIQDLSTGGLGSALSGMVNGLSISGGESRPGENASIYIRDTKSLGDVGVTAQEPLYVIDGIIYPNDVKVGNTTQNLGSEMFNNLDPSVVESISVLKDASAAVYGARAANGVIIVTTKKGKLGAPSISYSGTFGVADEVGRSSMLSAYNYGRMYNAIKAADPYNTSLNKTTDLFQADELAAMKNLNYDLLDKYWSSAFTMKHSINASGATERANYFASVSYYDQDGNLGKLDYDRWNYRAGVDLKISKHLKANLTVSGDYGTKNKPLVKIGGSSDEKDYNLLLTHPRYIPETVGDYSIISNGPTNNLSSDNQYYNFAVMQNNGDYSKTMTSNTTINAGLTYDFDWLKPLKGLNVRFNYGKTISTTKNNEYATEFTLYKMTTRYGSGMHLYTPVTGGDDEAALLDASNFSAKTVANGDKSYLSRNMTRTDNYQMNLTLAYDRDFGLHHVGALFSIEKSETESEYVYAKRTNPYEFTTGQSNSVNSSSEQDNSFTRSESGTLSYVGRVNYAYASKYLLEFLIRSDASTKFAPKNYWGTFPSFSAGWVASEEEWFQKALPWINYLKLRASFGITGRDNTAAWQWMRIYSQDSYRGPIFGETSGGSSLPRIGFNKNNSAVNEDVHWDKSYKGNIGLDFNVLNNRLAVTFEAYRTWNREMLMKIAQDVPSTVGTQSAAMNLGEVDSWGYELSLNWKDKIGKNFKYHIGINAGYSDNKVKVMDWDKSSSKYMAIQKNGRSDVGVWGMQCLGMFRTFQEINEYFDTYLKNDNGTYGTYMGLTKDDVRPGMLIYKDVRGALQDDGTFAGPNKSVSFDEDCVQLSKRSSNPFGFTSNFGFDYKKLSVSAQVNVGWGAYAFVPASALKFSNSIEYTNMPSFWNPDNMFVYDDIYDGSGNLIMAQNRNASLPNLSYYSVNSVQSSFWRINGTTAKLSRLTIAYTLPNNWLKPIGVQSCRINVTGQNLWSIVNHYPDKFMDPMNTYGSYPTLRKFTFGINLSF
jgi:TonB-linked SusC/RagA family outer membrane protein